MTNFKKTNCFALFLAGLFLCLIAGGRASELQLLSSEVVKGKLSFASGKFDCGGRKVSPESVLLARIGSPGGGGERQSRVFLSSGDIFAAEMKSGSLRENVTLIRQGGQMLEFSLAQVRAVQINPFETGVALDTSISGSQVQMTNGKAIACTVEWITPEEVGIKTPAGSLRLQRSLVARLVLGNSEAKSAPLAAVKGGWLCRVISRTGDDFSAYLIAMNSKQLKAKAACGELSLPVEDVLCLLSMSSAVVPLTSLRPAGVKTIPYLDFVRKPRLNQGLLGGALYCSGMQWRYGISTHSRTEISYKLDKGYSLFSTFIGINKISDSRVRAVAVVDGDNKELAKADVEAGQPLQYIAVDVSGVQTLKIIFDYGPDGSRGDHGVWGLPLLVKSGAKASKASKAAPAKSSGNKK